jgi:hypothetical protein
MKLPAMRSVKEITSAISQQLELIICGLSTIKMIHYQGNIITDMIKETECQMLNSNTEDLNLPTNSHTSHKMGRGHNMALILTTIHKTQYSLLLNGKFFS